MSARMTTRLTQAVLMPTRKGRLPPPSPPVLFQRPPYAFSSCSFNGTGSLLFSFLSFTTTTLQVSLLLSVWNSPAVDQLSTHEFHVTCNELVHSGSDRSPLCCIRFESQIGRYGKCPQRSLWLAIGILMCAGRLCLRAPLYACAVHCPPRRCLGCILRRLQTCRIGESRARGVLLPLPTWAIRLFFIAQQVD